jgi:hypothetical protein
VTNIKSERIQIDYIEEKDEENSNNYNLYTNVLSRSKISSASNNHMIFEVDSENDNPQKKIKIEQTIQIE